MLEDNKEALKNVPCYGYKHLIFYDWFGCNKLQREDKDGFLDTETSLDKCEYYETRDR